MKLKILTFLILIFGVYSCIAPKYFAMRTSELINMDLDNSITNYIPVSDEILKNSGILDSTLNMIINKEYHKLSKYLKSMENSGKHSPDLYLSKALFFITCQDYNNAMLSLNNLQKNEFPLLKRLLTIDITYELSRINNVSGFNNFLNDYQGLIDTYPDDITLKKIVSIRLRYLRYNY